VTLIRASFKVIDEGSFDGIHSRLLSSEKAKNEHRQRQLDRRAQ
jgi:hypothetical protein